MNDTTAQETPGEYGVARGAPEGLTPALDVFEQVELLHADMPRIRQALADQAESIRDRFDKLHAEGYFDARSEHIDASEARRNVEASFKGFLSSYFTDDGVDDWAIATLAETVVSKIDVVPVSELMDAARTLVEEGRGKTIYLWVPSDKIRDADWESPYSLTSNEFMAKLVQRYARLADKTVELVSEADEIAGHEHELSMIDDVAYTGSQIGSSLLSLSRRINNQPAQINLYVARAANSALDSIRADAAYTRSISVYPKATGGRIQNLSTILEYQSLAWQYFWVKQLASELEEELRDPREVLTGAGRFFGRETLTMLPNKVPDAVSFPDVIAQGLPRPEGRDKYPDLNDLHFTLGAEPQN